MNPPMEYIYRSPYGGYTVALKPTTGVCEEPTRMRDVSELAWAFAFCGMCGSTCA